MDFLKNHYEKMILTVLLILFVLSLFYLINVIKTVQDSVDGSDLQFPEVKADYAGANFTADIYNFSEYVKKMPTWQMRKKINETDKVFTQLIEPFQIAQCPLCKKYIAVYFFENDPHKCPLCGGDLPKPQANLGPSTEGIDTDGDGLSDKEELAAGLNPKDATDSDKDLDNDGFTNRFELQNKPKTDINDPKSHPPLALRFYVFSISRNKLGVRLQKLQVKGDNRDDWDIQVEVIKGRRKDTKFLKLNSTFTVGNEEFKIVDCRAKKETVINEKTKMEETRDISEVTIQSVKGDEKIVMIEKQDVYSSKERVVLGDVSDDNKTYHGMLGESIKIGTKETGIETYKIVSVDSAKKIVVLVNETDNKTYDISEKKRFEFNKSESSAMNPGMMGQDPATLLPPQPAVRPPKSRTKR